MNLGQIIDPARVWGEGKTHDDKARREKQPAPTPPVTRTVRCLGDADPRAVRAKDAPRRRNRPPRSTIAHDIRVQLDALRAPNIAVLRAALPHLSRKQVMSNLGAQIENGFVRTEGLRRHFRYVLTDIGAAALRMSLA